MIYGLEDTTTCLVAATDTNPGFSFYLVLQNAGPAMRILQSGGGFRVCLSVSFNVTNDAFRKTASGWARAALP